MRRIDIKPLSVNDAWKGRRFKTVEYTAYEKELYYLLPRELKIPEGKLKLKIKWGFSSKGSDYDNPIKPFTDVLQKKYGFNDNRIYKASQEKIDVEKGKEFIEFKLSKYYEKTN